MEYTRKGETITPKHFLRQFEPSAAFIGHTTSFSGSKGPAGTVALGGMALVDEVPCMNGRRYLLGGTCSMELSMELGAGEL